MSTLLSMILPTIIILLPCVLYVIFRLIIKNRIIPKTIIAGILLFILGLVAPWIAMGVSIKGLRMAMPDGGCYTGASIFYFFGYIVNLFGIPLLGLIFVVLEIIKKKKKKY